MDTNIIVACWHVGDFCRLRANLESGMCDLPEKKNGEIWVWDKRMRLDQEDRVQFCISNKIKNKGLAGLIVATGTIASKPHPCKHPKHPSFPMCVKIKNVKWLKPPLERCRCYHVNPQFGSHRCGGKGPCSSRSQISGTLPVPQN